MKAIYESTGKGYTQQGDYLLPNLQLNEEPKYNIGIGTTLSSVFKKQSQNNLLQLFNQWYIISTPCRSR